MIICIVISILVVCISFFIFKATFGNMNIKYYLPHMHLFYYQMVAMCMVGGVLMYCGVRSTVHNRFGLSDHSVWLAMLSIWYVFLSVPLFIFIFMRRWGRDKRDSIKIYIEQDVKVDDSHIMRMFGIACTLFCVVCVAYMYYVRAPIFQLIDGSIDNVLVARVAYTRTFTGSQLVKNIFCETLAVLVSYVMFVFAFKLKKKFWISLACVCCVCGILISGASLSKSGMVVYLIPFVFLLVLCGCKISLGKYTKLGIVIMVMVLYFYVVQTGGSVSVHTLLTDFWAGPIGRVFIGQIHGLPAYFMIFPSQYEHILFSGIPIVRFFGMEYVQSARVAATFLEPVGVTQGWVGVSNTLFVGDAYACFGWIGLILSPIIVGWWIAFFYKKMYSSEKNPVYMVAYICILDKLVSGFTGGFCSSYLINTQIIAIVLFIFLYNVFLKTTKRKIVIH